MKTIEEKAKAYDEALEKAKAILTGLIDCRDAPDLEWSNFGGINIDECIAWLEKQKVTDEEIIFRPVAGTDIRIAAKQALEKIDIGKKVVLAFNGAYIPVNGKTVGEIDSEYDAWLEKQGKTFTKRDIDDAYLKGVCDAKQELEKQDEIDNCPLECSTNTVMTDSKKNQVEPKFHEGDWITNGLSYPMQISSIDDGMYYTHNDTVGGDIESIDKEYHLWTIQDAKDGDVLVDEDIDVIGVFEGIEGMCWHSKFYYSNTTKEFYGIDCGGSHRKEFAKPATKEQRDTLMKAIADAGYEWDAEKKELKLLITNGGDFESENCEQKSAWSYEDEANLNNIIWLCNNCIKGSETTWIPSQAKKIKHLIETIKERGLVQQTSAWSEEDEWKFSDILALLRGGENCHYNTPDLFDWFKSLKDRVQPQPKQEWSEEDETGWTNTMIMIKECASNHYTKDSVKLVIDWLYSLKERIGE